MVVVADAAAVIVVTIVVVVVVVVVVVSVVVEFDVEVSVRPYHLQQTWIPNGVSEIAAPHRRRAPAFRTFVLQLRITAI